MVERRVELSWREVQNFWVGVVLLGFVGGGMFGMCDLFYLFSVGKFLVCI
jgi:hypothetical protein